MLKVRIWLLVALLFVVPRIASAQPDFSAMMDLQRFSQEMMVHFRNGDLEKAIGTNDRVIARLAGKTDWLNGTILNRFYVSRASLKFAVGRYGDAEADLIAAVEQLNAMRPSAFRMPGMPADMPPQFAAQLQSLMPNPQSMLNAQKRYALTALLDFYLAAGDYKRANEIFHQAIAIPVPDGKALGAMGLSAATTSLKGSFYRRTGDYDRAFEAYVEELGKLDQQWQAQERVAGGNLIPAAALANCVQNGALTT